MRLVGDASSLVAEAFRARGEQILKHPNVDLYIAAATWSEVAHEVERRIDALVRHGRITVEERSGFHRQTMTLLADYVGVVTEEEYSRYEAAALIRIGHRDPNDWPTVAVALALDAAIWTSDRDFFGCGLPVWSTDTLLAYLPEMPASA